jgi:hypothetical protein
LRIMALRSYLHLRVISFFLAFIIVCGFTACDYSQNGDIATFAVQLHDSSADFQEVNIHVKRIEVRQSKSGEAGWEVIEEPDETYNLLELVNGNTALLGKKEIEPARYTQVRLMLGEDNSVVRDGQSYDLSINGNTSVIMDINADLSGGDYYVLNVDFDVSRSIQMQGDTEYLLDPVVRAYTEAERGTIEGFVSMPDESRARINAIISDTLFTSTSTDETSGGFKLMGLESGTYGIEIDPQQDGMLPEFKQNIEVSAGETTKLETIDFGDSDSDPLEDESWSGEELVPGVELLRQHYDNLFLARQYVSILKIDTSEPGVQIRIASTYFYDDVDGRLPVSAFGERDGAVAATNPGHPRDDDVYNSGILKTDGEVIPFLREEPNDDLKFIGGSAFGVDENGNWRFTRRPGDRWPPDWPEVEHASAGSQMLISDGEITERIEQEQFISSNENRHANRRHPRTAVCLRYDSTGILITVDGRAEEADGMTLKELAQYMQSLGCEDAINFDGGGSTTMWTQEHGVVNHPSDNDVFDHNGQRDIRAAIIIKYASN